MCGRFVNKHDRSQFRHWVDTDWDEDDEQLEISFNVAPTQRIYTIRVDDEGTRRLYISRWGLIASKSKSPKPLINARGEGVAKTFPFKFSFGARRCVVPMSGYYEWTGERPDKQPHFIRAADGGLLAAAGIYERAPDKKTGELTDTVAIITTGAATDLAAVHHRMPVFIPPEKHQLWLDRETPIEVAQQLLLPMSGLRFATVSKRVNVVKNNSADLLDPLAA